MLSGQLTLASSPLFGGVGIQPPLTGVQGVHASHGNAEVWAEALAGKSAPATRLRQSSVHNSRSIDPPEGSRDVTPTPRPDRTRAWTAALRAHPATADRAGRPRHGAACLLTADVQGMGRLAGLSRAVRLAVRGVEREFGRCIVSGAWWSSGRWPWPRAWSWLGLRWRPRAATATPLTSASRAVTSTCSRPRPGDRSRTRGTALVTQRWAGTMRSCLSTRVHPRRCLQRPGWLLGGA